MPACSFHSRRPLKHLSLQKARGGSLSHWDGAEDDRTSSPAVVAMRKDVAYLSRYCEVSMMANARTQIRVIRAAPQQRVYNL